MSSFTLAISCLPTSDLPWFMDITFQVPMQYCSLQHWTLLLFPVTSTAGCCFCFGSVSSLFLELFLHYSPVAYWTPTDLGRHLSTCGRSGDGGKRVCCHKKGLELWSLKPQHFRSPKYPLKKLIDEYSELLCLTCQMVSVNLLYTPPQPVIGGLIGIQRKLLHLLLAGMPKRSRMK